MKGRKSDRYGKSEYALKLAKEFEAKEKERAKVISIFVNIVMWKYKPTKKEIIMIKKYVEEFGK